MNSRSNMNRTPSTGAYPRRLGMLVQSLRALGLDFPQFLRAVRFLPLTIREYNALKRQNKNLGLKYNLRFGVLYLNDRYSASGTASGHYFHQDLLVARRILKRHPVKHVDVGSRVDGFVAHVATFRTIEVLDIRALRARVPNIIFRQCDLMDQELGLSDYCDSISCLHALEHFGLGRYGDTLDIEGHLRGLNNLHRILKSGGILYLSVPIGPDRIEFNGQRVFAIATVLGMVKNLFELIGFSYIDDQGDLHESTTLDPENVATNCGCYYGCGIFELKKLAEN